MGATLVPIAQPAQPTVATAPCNPGVSLVNASLWYQAAAEYDANALQINRAGVATGLVSIPNRYMHRAVEVVSLDDVEAHHAGLVCLSGCARNGVREGRFAALTFALMAAGTVAVRLARLRQALGGRSGPWGGCVLEPDVLLRLARAVGSGMRVFDHTVGAAWASRRARSSAPASWARRSPRIS